MSLAERLKERIRASGPLPFEDFMEACLYDSGGGFFSTGPLRSVESGDFLTSPEVSAWFGRMLARFAAGERDRLGEGPFLVADVGAGSGSLLAGLASAVGGPVDLWAIDRSPAARDALRAGRDWAVGTTIEDLPARATGVIVANELLDNLPVAVVVRAGGRWEERWVGIDGDALGLVAAPVRRDVAEWADRFGGRVPEGGLVEVQLAAGRWLQFALDRLRRGAVVVVDYGGTAEELEPRRTQGTLRTYRSHHLGPDPLLAPGETDVTVDVNFSALTAVAARAGAEVELLRQDDFLRELGLGEEVASLRRRELDLARDGDAIERLRVRSERTDAETLMHPRGLGDFRVLIARKR